MQRVWVFWRVLHTAVGLAGKPGPLFSENEKIPSLRAVVAASFQRDARGHARRVLPADAAACNASLVG